MHTHMTVELIGSNFAHSSPTFNTILTANDGLKCKLQNAPLNFITVVKENAINGVQTQAACVLVAISVQM